MRPTSLRLVPCRGGTRAEVRSFPILYKNPASSGRCFPVGGELPNCAEFGGFLRLCYDPAMPASSRFSVLLLANIPEAFSTADRPPTYNRESPIRTTRTTIRHGLKRQTAARPHT